MMDKSFHYHAELACGHKMGFDLKMDMFAVASEHYAEAQIELSCSQCNKITESTHLTLVGQNILVCECGKGLK